MKLLIALLFTASLFGQAVTGGLTPKGVVNAGGATSTAPHKTGTSLPATCTIGQTYFKTDSINTAVQYACTATNTWTQQSGNTTGAIVLLATLTANNTSAEMDVTTRNATGQSGAIFQSDYDEYEIDIVSAFDATTNQSIILQLSGNGGATYETTGVYNMGRYEQPLDANSGAFQLITAAPGCFWSYYGQTSNVATGGVSGHGRIYNPLSTAISKVLYYEATYVNTDTNHYHNNWACRFANGGGTGALNAFRFTTYSGTGAFSAGGNLTSGRVSVYGIAK